jgi:hypothetical protein
VTASQSFLTEIRSIMKNLLSYSCDIGASSETWLNDKVPNLFMIDLHLYTVFRRVRSTGQGRCVCYFVKDDHELKAQQSFTAVKICLSRNTVLAVDLTVSSAVFPYRIVIMDRQIIHQITTFHSSLHLTTYDICHWPLGYIRRSEFT